MQICHNTDLITLCKNQREIKTVGWLEQVRIPMEKDRDEKDITPTYEDFLKNGTVRNPRITAGDSLTNDIHRVGLISSRKMSAQKMLETKRNHWKIVYNLLRITIIVEKPGAGPTEMRDQFSDDLTLIEKYLFRGIPSYDRKNNACILKALVVNLDKKDDDTSRL